LRPENKQKALELITALEASNLEEVDDLLDGIEEELSNISRDLGKAVTKAIKAAPKTVQKFGSNWNNIHWSTYKACMKRNGVFLPYDLNRELTQDILPSVQVTWNKAINNRIPLIIKDAIRSIEESTFTAIDKVVEVLAGRGILYQQTITAARRSLAIETILGDLLKKSIESISVAQREGTRSFKAIVQEGMSAQYRLAALESGVGCWARMKSANQEFIKSNAPNVFGPINTHIEVLLHKAATKIKVDMRTELKDMTALLRLNLIDEINLSEDHKELKEDILQLTLATRPQFVLKKMDLDGRRLSLKI